MEHRRLSFLSTFLRVVYFVCVFFLGRYSYVNNTEVHSLPVGVAILLGVLIVYILIERSVKKQIVHAVFAVQAQQVAHGRSLIKKIDVSLKVVKGDKKEEEET